MSTMQINHSHELNDFLTLIRGTPLDCVLLSNGEKEACSLKDAILHTILYKVEGLGLNESATYKLKRTLTVTESTSEVSLLEQRIIDLLVLNQNPLLRINKHGELVESFSGEGTILFDLRQIINETFPGLPINFDADTLKLVSRAEQKTLELLRNENFHSVKVIKRGGKLDRAESQQHVNTSKRVIDIMKDAEFQDIEIKQESGKAVHINRVVKTKLN